MTKVSAWRSVLELRDLLATIFYGRIKCNGGSSLAIAVVLVASVTDSHGRELPNAPVNVIEITQKYADILGRRLNCATIEYRLVGLFVTFAIGNGKFFGALFGLFITHKKP